MVSPVDSIPPPDFWPNHLLPLLLAIGVADFSSRSGRVATLGEFLLTLIMLDFPPKEDMDYWVFSCFGYWGIEVAASVDSLGKEPCRFMSWWMSTAEAESRFAPSLLRDDILPLYSPKFLTELRWL